VVANLLLMQRLIKMLIKRKNKVRSARNSKKTVDWIKNNYKRKAMLQMSQHNHISKEIRLKSLGRVNAIVQAQRWLALEVRNP